MIRLGSQWGFQTLAMLFVLGMTTSCDRPPPRPLQRALSPDGKAELVLWQEDPSSILEGHVLITAARPGVAYADANLVANIKYGQDIEAYWTGPRSPVVLADSYQGWVTVKIAGENAFATACLGSRAECRRSNPLATGTKRIRLGGASRGLAQKP